MCDHFYDRSLFVCHCYLFFICLIRECVRPDASCPCFSGLAYITNAGTTWLLSVPVTFDCVASSALRLLIMEDEVQFHEFSEEKQASGAASSLGMPSCCHVICAHCSHSGSHIISVVVCNIWKHHRAFLL